MKNFRKIFFVNTAVEIHISRWMTRQDFIEPLVLNKRNFPRKTKIRIVEKYEIVVTDETTRAPLFPDNKRIIFQV